MTNASRTLLAQALNTKGSLTMGAEPLGRGGEGAVYEVLSHEVDGLPPAEELVAKIYHGEPQAERTKKLVSMVKAPPDSDALAWPLALLVERNAVVGYVMVKLSYDKYRPWAELAHTQERRQASTDFDVRYAYTAALNFAYALSSVHAAGHALGDINESNAFIANDAQVFIVDTDSAQIKSPTGEIFRCLVGKPEFTAAELTKGAFRDQDRTVASDVFGFAVLVYQILLGGPHPTDGIFQGDGEPPDVQARIRAGAYPNLTRTKVLKPLPRVASEALPKELRQMLLAALDPSPERRPSLDDLEACLEIIADTLVHCKKVKEHWYSPSQKKCPWCAHVAAGQPDPWAARAAKPSSKAKKQRALKGVDFKKPEKASGAAPRAPRAPRAPAPPAGATARPAASHAPRGFSSSGGVGGSQPSAFAETPDPRGYFSPRFMALPKVKGKSVLTYVDGSQAVRPELTKLFQSNSKVATQCFVNELSDPYFLGWRPKSSIPSPQGLLLGLLLALMVSVVTALGLPQLLSLLMDAYLPQVAISEDIYGAVGLLLAATSFLAPLLKALGTWGALRQIKRRAATDLSVFPREQPLLTGGRGLLTALAWGVPLLFYALALIFMALMGLLSAMVRGGDGR